MYDIKYLIFVNAKEYFNVKKSFSRDEKLKNLKIRKQTRNNEYGNFNKIDNLTSKFQNIPSLALSEKKT